MRRSWKLRAAWMGLWALGSAAGAARADAATATWDGGGSAVASGVTLWSDPNNWSGNVAPSPAADVSIGTGFTSGRTIRLTTATTVNKLTFTATGVDLRWSFGGPFPLTVTTGDVIQTQGTNTISTDVVMGAFGNWTISSGRLRVDGDISGGEGGFFEGLYKDGDGELQLYGDNAYPGITWVTDGKLTVGANGGLPAGTMLFVDGNFADSTEVSILSSVAVDLGTLLIDGQGTLTGASSTASVHADDIELRDDADLNVKLVGATSILVTEGAEARIGKSGTYTGTTTVESGATLSVYSDGALGASGNTVELQGAELQVEVTSTLTSGHTVRAASGSSFLSGSTDIAAKLAGPGYLEISGRSTNPDVTIRGNNAGFTGRLAFDGGVSGAGFRFASSQAFGAAQRVDFYGLNNDVYIDADIAAEPTLALGPGGRLEITEGRDASFSTLDIGGDAQELVVHYDLDGSIIHFELIDLDAAMGGQLDIHGWVNNVTEIYVDTGLDACALNRINFVDTPFPFGAVLVPPEPGAPVSGYQIKPRGEPIVPCN